MAALITMAGIDACANQAMTDIKARTQRCFHIRAVERIYIHCIVCAGLLRSVDELADYIIIVGTAGILGADRNLLFRTLQAVTHAAISTEIASVTPAGTLPLPP